MDSSKCLTPCKGLYADVKRDIEVKKVEDSTIFNRVVENYENYKRGYIMDINYPRQLEGKTLKEKMNTNMPC